MSILIPRESDGSEWGAWVGPDDITDPAWLAKHDAKVLRAAADAFSTEALGFSDKGWGSNPVDQAAIGVLVKALAWLRERADRIAGDRP